MLAAVSPCAPLRHTRSRGFGVRVEHGWAAVRHPNFWLPLDQGTFLELQAVPLVAHPPGLVTPSRMSYKWCGILPGGGRVELPGTCGDRAVTGDITAMDCDVTAM